MGRAGKLLDELLAEAGLEREDVYITNVVKARPPTNRDPKPAEVAHHMEWLERELALIQPRLVIPLGPPRAGALHRWREDLRRPRHRDDRARTVAVPLYHPAAALRGVALRETLFEDARKLKTALRRAAVARRARSSRRPAGS